MRASWPPGKGIVNLHSIFACSLFSDFVLLDRMTDLQKMFCLKYM